MWEIITSNLEVLQAMPVLNIQLLLDGIFIGAIFALAAYGLALVWGVMNVKNLAQGDFEKTVSGLSAADKDIIKDLLRKSGIKVSD